MPLPSLIGFTLGLWGLIGNQFDILKCTLAWFGMPMPNQEVVEHAKIFGNLVLELHNIITIIH
jgi:hypothetical protein